MCSPQNCRSHWSKQDRMRKWFSASAVCVLDTKHCTFGSISHPLKPIEESRTEGTILPPSTLFSLIPLSLFLFLSYSVALYLYLSLPPQPNRWVQDHVSGGEQMIKEYGCYPLDEFLLRLWSLNIHHQWCRVLMSCNLTGRRKQDQEADKAEEEGGGKRRGRG